MAANSSIEWTDATWNPVLGCSKVSPGCKRCYAMRVVHRLAANPNAKVMSANAGLTVIQNGEPNWTGVVREIPSRLAIPLENKKPTRYFVNSLSDLFHEDLSHGARREVCSVMREATWHTFQVLTKRAEIMREFAVWWCVQHAESQLPPHWWMGVSIEDRERLYRLDLLRHTPAAVRFLSLEPLLEDLGMLDLTGIDWVIVGGESGKGARPMHPDWVRSIQRQCEAACVPFFFKQWGEYGPWPDNPQPVTSPGRRYVRFDGKVLRYGESAGNGQDLRDFTIMQRTGKKKAGRLLDGRTWDEMPILAMKEAIRV